MSDHAGTYPIIELKNITRRYNNGGSEIQVLHGIDLQIYAGEFVAIVGSSGSGKSTLMNILGCLDHPSSGSYYFEGEDVASLSADDLARLRRDSFGFVFQSYNLILNESARENVEVPAIYAGLPTRERHERARHLLTQLGLGEKMDNRPKQLSGGQQQRVSIARALMNGGHVIMADEPTGALDSRSGVEVMALFKKLSDAGHTIILITHDIKVAEQADRVIEIRDGHIIADSGPKARPEREPLSPEVARRPSMLADMLEATRMAVRAMQANLFRTLLTMLGIIIGVASVVAMMAIGNGAKQSVVDQITAMGTNLLLVRPGIPGQRGWGGIRTLVPEDATAINELDNVLAAIPELDRPATVRYGNRDYSTRINATTARFIEARDWPVAHGTFFTSEDEQLFATVAVLGQTAAQTLFPDEDPLGRFIMADSLLLQVIGVMTPKGADPSSGNDQDDIVFVPFSTGSLRLFGDRPLRNITVAVEDVDRIEQTHAEVHALLLQRHGMEDFRIQNMTALLESRTETLSTLTVLLGAIAAISLLVGGIGVMNIMLVSVSERTKEIGIRMAVGARGQNILQQFMIEAVVVSALGGLMGIAIGLGTTWIIEYLGTPVVHTISPVVIAFSCAFLTGLLFGFMPARKASRLNPVVALNSK